MLVTGELPLEPARSTDAARIAAMSRRLVERGLPARWSRSRIAAGIRDPDVEVVVARSGVELAGFGMMSFDFAARRAHLLLFAVEPRWRRRRLGAALFGYLEALAKRGGIAELRLEVRARNRGARAFYRTLGFAEASRLPGYYECREDALVLVRTLSSPSGPGARPPAHEPPGAGAC